MHQDYVCGECGNQYDDLGNGKCYACGGNIISIDEVGEDELEYPEDLMSEETEEKETPPEELEEWEEPGVPPAAEQKIKEA